MNYTDEQRKIIDDISRLYGFVSARESKYIRNLNRYLTNGPVRDSVYNLRGLPPANIPPITEYGIKTKVNAQKSAIDTMASKLSQLKVRPFFNPVDASFKADKACRHAQIFFDKLFSELHIPSLMAESTRDAIIFDVGEQWVDDKAGKIVHVHPWSVLLDPAEYDCGYLSRICLSFKQIPASKIVKDIELYGNGELKDAAEVNAYIRDLFERDRADVRDYVVYYDLFNKKRYDIYDTYFFFEKSLDFDCCPVNFIFYNRPVKGFFSTSAIDDTYGIQHQIDEMGDRVDAATRTAPFAFITVPRSANSRIRNSQMSNEPYIIIEYDAIGGGKPEINTPSPISGEYQAMIDALETKLFNQLGVSQLSAQSKKPAGVTSGVALQTLEDVESDRFNVLVSDVVEAYVNLAKILIQVLPGNEEILPKTLLRRDSVTWAEVKKNYKLYQIQFSSTSSLSKDPATKMEQINQLVNMGFLSKEVAAKFLDMPDLEKAFEDITAAEDYCNFIIDKAVETGSYEFYEVVDLNYLFNRVVTTACRISTSGDEEAIKRLIGLMDFIQGKIISLQTPDVPAVQPEAAPPQAAAQPAQPAQTMQPPGGVPMGNNLNQTGGVIV